MTTKLYKATDVCEIAQLQPYVLRSWEKEFPGIGVQRSAEGPRMYRDEDLEQVQRIKHLVFVEGLTLAGARRRLEGTSPALVRSAPQVVAAPVPAPQPVRAPQPPPPVPKNGAKSSGRTSPMDDGARARIAHVRAGLQSILELLGGSASVEAVLAAADEYQLKAPPAKAARARVRKIATRRPPAPAKKSAAAKRTPVTKRPVAKRKRASA
jgi:DNA-binding transcriptional MerR regulator